jgi:hypothetical protein
VEWQDNLESAEPHVLGLLKNPSYAGIYVFGRYQYRREINLDGEVRKRMQAVAMFDWCVSLQQHHEGYITLEAFVNNRERLQKNRTNGEETVLSGPTREGLALLQGLLLCGNCGSAMGNGATATSVPAPNPDSTASSPGAKTHTCKMDSMCESDDNLAPDAQDGDEFRPDLPTA